MSAKVSDERAEGPLSAPPARPSEPSPGESSTARPDPIEIVERPDLEDTRPDLRALTTPAEIAEGIDSEAVAARVGPFKPNVIHRHSARTGTQCAWIGNGALFAELLPFGEDGWRFCHWSPSTKHAANGSTPRDAYRQACRAQRLAQHDTGALLRRVADLEKSLAAHSGAVIARQDVKIGGLHDQLRALRADLDDANAVIADLRDGLDSVRKTVIACGGPSEGNLLDAILSLREKRSDDTGDIPTDFIFRRGLDRLEGPDLVYWQTGFPQLVSETAGLPPSQRERLFYGLLVDLAGGPGSRCIQRWDQVRHAYGHALKAQDAVPS